MPRRFKPPWAAERIPGGCVVKDASPGQAPAYAREMRADADTTKLPKLLPRKFMARS
jgi:hypothetical protein